VHDVILVDCKSPRSSHINKWLVSSAPAFHFSIDTCTGGEVCNLAIRGSNEGGLDGIDVWGSNIWIHDVEVTNKDECVTVKSHVSDMLIENIYYNWSGGSAIGSLGDNTSTPQLALHRCRNH